MPDIEALRTEWRTLYSKTLPQMAKSRDPAQTVWPVTLDHCFARIILDRVVGNGQQQWDMVIQKPAIRNMNEHQLRDAIALGERIRAGQINLSSLDEASLLCRGKNERKYAKTTASDSEAEAQSPHPGKSGLTNAGCKRTIGELDPPAQSSTTKNRKTEKHQSTLNFWRAEASTKVGSTSNLAEGNRTLAKAIQADEDEMKRTLRRIHAHPSLSAYRKKLYATLLSVPRGRYTTYAAISDYLKSSARAVGNGMRNNPFAPAVPCHRVLAADGSIGGFQGDWGRDGKYASKKVELLRSEGVKFDGRGKVLGEPFRDFEQVRQVEDGIMWNDNGESVRPGQPQPTTSF
ncbi:uncharacterized protein Z520_01321 [Fonsecaea multimorphosa CBS 102226]|uniref:Methylated-DNA--protein-cysteine methyltransferase n=1 Tax=Fonsecaea multimorphosa CBS 102226 TaxID=1442371 RepID=A0A0D2HLU3_9EURO|nr:uncharacterized protein Z520_01321 [Fonsecaea multimorphosa CBS 102226]KIY02856.1 hypothetical protein Z520_01321 [Fonsecaea multimorphosa CBS 102226]OAL30694.1 hypothetical protein AYO22_01314 [Fonsecaea multimorphosa]